MTTLKFKCHLDSDVVLNQSAATEGSNSTLDFIPGNVFLGIVARHYDEFGNDALEVFHSGKVRFGDAHPVPVGYAGKRSLHVPASLFYPKLKSACEECYVHHLHDNKKDEDNIQLKQCRKGFYVFDSDSAHPASVEKSFAIKSAYDRTLRRAKDEQMFGYESIDAGQDFLFEVEVNNDALADTISDMLNGIHYIGRSKNSQYGSVNIETCSYEDVGSRADTAIIDGKEYVTVYADGRLIFMDENGEPTFQPTPKDLGIEDGEIDWMKSQVRTFQYAPWNGVRAARDADRCGIEKGSVFVVCLHKKQTYQSQYVGSYRNEGFGKVIYNPEFLESLKGENGRAKVKLESVESVSGKNSDKDKPELSGTPLLDYIAGAQKKENIDKYIYEKVNEFVGKNKARFQGDAFASQWGAIRTIAMQKGTHENIMKELFTKTKEKNGKSVEDAYLTHGVAKDKWAKSRRKDNLEEFLSDVFEEAVKEEYGDITARALINLASEMAKQSKSM